MVGEGVDVGLGVLVKVGVELGSGPAVTAANSSAAGSSAVEGATRCDWSVRASPGTEIGRIAVGIRVGTSATSASHASRTEAVIPRATAARLATARYSR